MPSRTFGGAAADDISQVRNVSLGASASVVLMSGWFRPTTLTLDRGLIGAGLIYGPSIDTGVTDELRLYGDAATTDGEWTTDNLDLATNNWYHLSFLSTMLDTGSAESWRVWQGTADLPPAAESVTNVVASSGNWTGNTTLTIGNAGTQALAFQGQIGQVLVVAQSAVGNTGALPIGTAGTITDQEAAQIYDRWIFPFWAGGGLSMRWATPPSSAGVIDITFWDGVEGVLQQFSRGGTIRQPLIVPTINGTSVSAESPPRSHDPRWMFGTS